MHSSKYIYSINYDDHERALSMLESKYIFNEEEKNKVVFSNLLIDPSSSAFIKYRLDLISYSEEFSTLIKQLKIEQIRSEAFKIEYLIIGGDKTDYDTKLEKLKDVGYSIEGNADYRNPTTIFALTHYNGVWYFGTIIKNNFTWRSHNEKPCSYSNSLTIHLAKALVNIAAKGNKANTLLDACCGVGTIMLEACFAGYSIEGCDINWKICRNARINIAHYGYDAPVYRCGVNEMEKRYDAAIIDLPYNLVSYATESDMLYIIESAAEISDFLVIVSTTDIGSLISSINYKVTDECIVGKRGKRKFSRRIWVCEKNIN